VLLPIILSSHILSRVKSDFLLNGSAYRALQNVRLCRTPPKTSNSSDFQQSPLAIFSIISSLKKFFMIIKTVDFYLKGSWKRAFSLYRLITLLELSRVDKPLDSLGLILFMLTTYQFRINIRKKYIFCYGLSS